MNRSLHMKDSEIEWIGKIPDHWQIRRLKYLAKIETGGKDTIDNEEDGKYPFFVRSQKIEKISTYSFDGEAVLTAGDGAGVGKVFHYFNGKFDFHQRVYKISDFKGIDGKYFYYFISENFHKEVMKDSAKSTVDSLRLPMLLNFPVILGNIEDQKEIAVFLDHETLKIESRIKNNRKLIELLKEKKYAIIDQTVTKGLNSAISTKDSGIEWLGQISKNFKILKFLSILERKKKRNDDDIQRKMLSVSQYLGVIEREYASEELIKSKEEAQRYFIVEPNDLVVNVMWLHFRGLGVSSIEGIVSPDYHVYRINSKIIEPRFLNYVVRSNVYVNVYSKYLRGIRPNSSRITQHDFCRLPLLLPPLEEQKLISKFLDYEALKIESLILKAESQIEKLHEFRHSLISSVVTGKMDKKKEMIV